MRTTPAECAELGRILAEKADACPSVVMIPRTAISVISAPGQPFHDPAADAALFDALRRQSHRPVEEFDLEINDPAFARACAERLLDLMARGDVDPR